MNERGNTKMKKTLKKIAVVLLVAALTVGFSLTASADETNMQSVAGSFNFTKEYESTDGTTFPSETLQFVVTADDANPDNTMITVGNGNSFAVTAINNQIPVNYPAFSKVGVYRYTIKELEGSSQGVTYDTDTEISVAIMVSYNENHDGFVVTAGVEKADPNAEKVGTIKNVYDFGGKEEDASDSLTVSKTVEGNLGDLEKYFLIHVTLTAEEGKTVASDIAISGGSNTDNPTTIKKGWVGSKTVNILLKNGDTVSFGQIPDGVTYKVEEDSSHIAAGDVQTPEELNSEEGYLATYTNEEGTITKDTKQEASVKNEKKTEINTGISLDSIPYLMMLAVVAFGALVIFRRRRVED